MIAPPTRTDFPFQTRHEIVENLWDKVVLPNWLSFRARQGDDKKAFMTAFIHGTSGVGKTRLDLELLRLMHEYASNSKFQCDSEVQELKQFLEESKTVVLDIRHLTNELTFEETQWPADVILGLRLAHQYRFPYVPYRFIRDTVMQRAKWAPRLLDTFKLSNVLDCIHKNPAAPTRFDPSSHIPRMIHIAVDEFQHAFDFELPYQGDKSLHAEELLSTALNRALRTCVSTARPDLFILVTFSGTSRHPKKALGPTDTESVDVLVPPLPLEASRRVVESLTWQTKSGHTMSGKDWVAFGRPFDRLLSSLGGNARALECLEQVLKGWDPLPEKLPLRAIFIELTHRVYELFNVASWGRYGSGRYGLLLALAGIPVHRGLVISPLGCSESFTVGDLERAGLVHLRPPPTPKAKRPSWIGTWNMKPDDVVMDVPLVVAKGARTHCHNESKLFYLAADLLDDFSLDEATFEEFALKHRVLRHSVASEFALRRKRIYVEARELFCGTICDRAFTKLRFKPEKLSREIYTAPAAVVWRHSAQLSDPDQAVAPSLRLQDDRQLDLCKSTPYAVVFYETNVVDSLLNEQLAGGQKALVLINCQSGAAQDGRPNYKDYIQEQIKKRRWLAHKLPQFEHIMVIAKRGKRPHTAETLLCTPSSGLPPSSSEATIDNRTCVISPMDDGLAWGFSPTFAWMLSGRRTTKQLSREKVCSRLKMVHLNKW